LYAFTENEKIIKNYKDNLNIDNKKIKEAIVINKYNNEIDTFLKGKLSNLTNILTDYYDTINSTFSNLKKELIDSINNIYNSLNNITEITKEILNGKYEKISNSTNRINKKRTNYIEEYKQDLKYVQKTENMMTNVTAYIDNLIEYGEFKLEFTLEGTKFKIPKIKAKIIDKTIPKNVEINVLSDYGFCYYKGYQIDIEFNNASYTSIIEYDIKSSYINITTYKEIEKYEYSIK
jgi:DNA-binding protein H-NS